MSTCYWACPPLSILISIQISEPHLLHPAMASARPAMASAHAVRASWPALGLGTAHCATGHTAVVRHSHHNNDTKFAKIGQEWAQHCAPACSEQTSPLSIQCQGSPLCKTVTAHGARWQLCGGLSAWLAASLHLTTRRPRHHWETGPMTLRQRWR